MRERDDDGRIRDEDAADAARIAALLRAASGEGPGARSAVDDAAAARVAAGAWARAATRGASPAPATGRGGPEARVLLRGGAWTAAAAAGLVAALIAPAGEARALAVEGAPVRVLDGGRWREARTAERGAWIWAPRGVRAVLDPDGGILRPDGGAVFRIGRGGEAGSLVEVALGRVEFTGGFAVVEGGGLRVERGRATPGTVFALACGADGPPHEPPEGGVAPRSTEVHPAAGVAVLAGRVRVRLAGSADDLDLGAAEEAAVVTLDGGRRRRLALRRTFEDSLLLSIAGGDAVVGAEPLAHDGVGLVIERREHGLVRADVPRWRVDDVLAGANEAMRVLVFRLGAADAREVGIRPRATVGPGHGEGGGDAATRVYEARGTGGTGGIVRVVVDASGGAFLQTADGPEEWFPCVAALRTARPDAVRPLAGVLPP